MSKQGGSSAAGGQTSAQPTHSNLAESKRPFRYYPCSPEIQLQVLVL